MKKIKLIAPPLIICAVFIAVVGFVKAELNFKYKVLAILISFLFICTNVVLEKFATNSEKFPLAYLAGTGIQFFSVLCIFTALVFKEMSDLKFVLLSLSTLFFVQILAQAVIMIRKINQ